MTDDSLHRLAEADPARTLVPPPDEALLARTLALPGAEARTTGPRPTAARRRRRGVRPAIALCALFGLAGLAVLVAPHGGRSLDLAAQAYAQTAAPPEQIVHTIVTTESVQQPDDGGAARHETGRVEEWHRGSETHRLETIGTYYGTQLALDHVTGADGTMRQVDEDGQYRIVRPSDNEDAANVIGQEQTGFVATFRRRYEQGDLDPAGDVQFAGRPARRYLVTPHAGTGRGDVIPGSETRQAFYIDRETGAPLGFTSTMRMNLSHGDGSTTAETQSWTQTVRTIERLDPTPANLAKLRTLTLPRRRDADGCIRGPATDARRQSTASKRDCGGTPGAPVTG